MGGSGPMARNAVPKLSLCQRTLPERLSRVHPFPTPVRIESVTPPSCPGYLARPPRAQPITSPKWPTPPSRAGWCPRRRRTSPTSRAPPSPHSLPASVLTRRGAHAPRYKQYRERQEAEHAAWLARQKEREEKLARGEDAGPAEPDPTEEQEVGCVGLTKLLLVLLLLAALAGKFFTGSFTWEYGASLKQFWPVRHRASGILSSRSGWADGARVRVCRRTTRCTRRRCWPSSTGRILRSRCIWVYAVSLRFWPRSAPA